LDTEQEIERAVEEIMKETRASKLDALNMLFSRYESQKRLEEAVRVRRIIDKVESNAEGNENGMRQDI
jgi:ferritin